jgi:hypothetical protein
MEPLRGFNFQALPTLTHLSLKTLYTGTVRFNVLLGAIKPALEVTQEELEAACRDANFSSSSSPFRCASLLLL